MFEYYMYMYVYVAVPDRTQMWQSRVEIEDYSITYFDHIGVFEVPYHWTFVKGGTHMHFLDA